MTDLTIICSDGDPLIVPIALATKIPYFQGMYNGFREGKDNILDLSSMTRVTCQDVIGYLTTKELVLPPTSDRRQTALGLARYWMYDEYIDVFCDALVAMTYADKAYIVETINLIIYIERWQKYQAWFDTRITSMAILSNIHILCHDAIALFFKIYEQDKSRMGYLFPLLRDWYLGDKDKSKVVPITKYLQTCPLTTFALAPKHRTKSFLELFPDPIFARRLAKIAIDHLEF